MFPWELINACGIRHARILLCKRSIRIHFYYSTHAFSNQDGCFGYLLECRGFRHWHDMFSFFCIHSEYTAVLYVGRFLFVWLWLDTSCTIHIVTGCELYGTIFFSAGRISFKKQSMIVFLSRTGVAKFLTIPKKICTCFSARPTRNIKRPKTVTL